MKYLVLVTILVLGSQCASWSKPYDVNFTDGKGENVEVKKSLFGHKTQVAQDRLGDEYLNKKGWFGQKDVGVGVLGNSVEHRKGLFGHNQTNFHDMLGDTVTTKNGWFSHKTNVDARGAANLIGHLMTPRTVRPTQNLPELPPLEMPMPLQQANPAPPR